MPTPKKQKIEVEARCEESEEEADVLCLYCHYEYSTSSEGWTLCLQCKKWAHNSCAGIDSGDDDSVRCCELCKSVNCE